MLNRLGHGRHHQLEQLHPKSGSWELGVHASLPLADPLGMWTAKLLALLLVWTATWRDSEFCNDFQVLYLYQTVELVEFVECRTTNCLAERPPHNCR